MVFCADVFTNIVVVFCVYVGGLLVVPAVGAKYRMVPTSDVDLVA